MAVPSNTYQAYQAVGIVEDLSKEVTMISPKDTFFYSKINEVGATQQKHEWLTDVLAAAADNAHIDGDDSTAAAAIPHTRLNNLCQIQKKVFAISGSNEKSKKADGKSEYDTQKAKNMAELAKDIEYAFLQGVPQTGTASVAAKMKGALNWTVTNLSKDAGATLNGTTGVVSGGVNRTFTEAIFKTVLANCYTAGGNPDTLYVDMTQKLAVSAWSQATSNYRTAVEESKLNQAVDVLMTDAGVVRVVPHRGMPSGVAFLCDHAYWKKATFRPTFSEPLAKTGDSQKHHIVVEHTLEARAENSSGRITNLT